MGTRTGRLLTIILAAALPASVGADEKLDTYYTDVAAFFNDSTSVLQDIVAEEIDPDELESMLCPSSCCRPARLCCKDGTPVRIQSWPLIRIFCTPPAISAVCSPCWATR